MILIANFGPVGAVKGLTNLHWCRGIMPRGLRSRYLLSFFLVFLVFLSPFSCTVSFQNDLKSSEEIRFESMSVGDSKVVEVESIPGNPYPSSDDFTIKIPQNSALDSLEFDLEPFVYTPSTYGYNNHKWDSQNYW